MPEGDTVWRAARRLREALEGRELTRTDFRVPAHATLDLSGQTVDEVLSRGKHLLIRVGEQSIHTHLKMEGVWHVYAHDESWRRPAHQARIVLETTDRQAVGFALGITEVVPRHDEGLDYLGPDLLGPDWNLDEAVRRVTSDPQRPVFLALHDQSSVAGFGNEYVNEICFLSGLLPTRPVGEIDAAKVIDRGRRTILVNRDRPGRVFTSSTRPGQTHWVYSRDRKPCRRCGTAIKRGELGTVATQMRNTFWCPHCQT
ncbi:DNA-formamidopyrimidine glycosylase family protein [Aeromicrobium sp. UC242_57]|uniref:DNA-formamidopyrimidine glycosylase family protein n=1 Tax=Aeromicrobium sp. UC242_57 TaxID=3374624 RepID=UPI0037A25260